MYPLIGLIRAVYLTTYLCTTICLISQDEDLQTLFRQHNYISVEMWITLNYLPCLCFFMMNFHMDYMTYSFQQDALPLTHSLNISKTSYYFNFRTLRLIWASLRHSCTKILHLPPIKLSHSFLPSAKHWIAMYWDYHSYYSFYYICIVERFPVYISP